MDKVIILGASALQLSGILKAKELGFYTIVCDYDPHAVGIKYADEFELISTIDTEAVLQLAREKNPKYVITTVSDAPVRTAAYVSRELGLYSGISYEDAICATVKSAMRDRLKQKGVPVPEYCYVDNEKDFLKEVGNKPYGCIIKPSDSAASRGVIFVEAGKDVASLKELFAYCSSYSHNKIVMVEELMKGPEVSVECFIVNRQVTILAVTDKLVCELPYFVELGHSEQTTMTKSMRNQVEAVAISAVQAIGIVDGVAHVEIKVTEEGPKIVEIAARLGGDYITARLVPLSTGVDMVGNSIALALQQPINITPTLNHGSAIRFIGGRKGIVRDININPDVYSLQGLDEIKVYVHPGDEVNDLHSSNDRIGHVIAYGNDADEAVRIAEKALEYVNIEIQ